MEKVLKKISATTFILVWFTLLTILAIIIT